MKRRTICVCLFLIYLLAVCMILSFKIEEEMQTQVLIRPVIVNEKSTGLFTLTLDCIFERYPENLLFELVPGSGWQEGPRIAQVDMGSYGVNPVHNTVSFATRTDRQIIRHASRFPVPGEKAVAVEQTTIEDQYLLIYPDHMPPFESHWEGVSLLAEGKNARLLHVTDAPNPFLENQTQEYLYQIQSPQWQIYSLHAASQFLTALPPLALLAGILWTMVILGIHSCVLIGNLEGHRRILLWNALIEGLLLLTLVLVLHRIDLPASLLPGDSILNLKHYSQEFCSIFKTLQELGQQELILFSQKQEKLAAAILLGSAAAPLLWTIRPAIHVKR